MKAIELVTWTCAVIIAGIIFGVYIVVYLTLLPFILLGRLAKFVAR